MPAQLRTNAGFTLRLHKQHSSGGLYQNNEVYPQKTPAANWVVVFLNLALKCSRTLSQRFQRNTIGFKRLAVSIKPARTAGCKPASGRRGDSQSITPPSFIKA